MGQRVRAAAWFITEAIVCVGWFSLWIATGRSSLLVQEAVIALPGVLLLAVLGVWQRRRVRLRRRLRAQEWRR